MKNDLLVNFSVDKENKKISVERRFAAPLPKVWAAWTESEILDQWWAPKPWKARTKEMDFTEGGHWLYAMFGPDGETHWSRADFKSIVTQNSFSSESAFCDEEGTITEDMPKSTWTNTFREISESTTVSIEILYNDLKDLEAEIEMGFKEGFTAGMENLDAFLK